MTESKFPIAMQPTRGMSCSGAWPVAHNGIDGGGHAVSHLLDEGRHIALPRHIVF